MVDYPIGLHPIKIVTAGDMSGTVTSPTINIEGVRGIYAQLVWTGDPTGTTEFNVSGDGINWDTLTTSAMISPAGSDGTGSFDVKTNAPFFQIVYTPASGSGSLDITAFAKIRQ